MGSIGNIINLIFMSQIVFSRSTLLLSFYIDIVLTLDNKMSWHFTRNCVKPYSELGISFNFMGGQFTDFCSPAFHPAVSFFWQHDKKG